MRHFHIGIAGQLAPNGKELTIEIANALDTAGAVGLVAAAKIVEAVVLCELNTSTIPVANKRTEIILIGGMGADAAGVAIFLRPGEDRTAVVCEWSAVVGPASTSRPEMEMRNA